MWAIRETKTMGDAYDTKEDAEIDADNNRLWYPENDYEVVEVNE